MTASYFPPALTSCPMPSFTLKFSAVSNFRSGMSKPAPTAPPTVMEASVRPGQWRRPAEESFTLPLPKYAGMTRSTLLVELMPVSLIGALTGMSSLKMPASSANASFTLPP